MAMEHPTISSVNQPQEYVQDNGTERKVFQLYNYESLDCQTIRLFRIAASIPDVDGKNPTYEIVHYNHDKAPDYVAISYEWGKLDDTHPLFLGDKKFLLITKNLHNALRSLQQSSNPYMFWADQVCINQRDISDRNQQVTRMANIFQRASTTFAWVGLEDENARRIHNLLKTIRPDGIDITDDYGPRSSSTVALGLQVHPDVIQRPPSPLLVKEMNRFINRSWFERLWIFQEVVLSKKLLLYCGTLQFDYDHLSKVFQALNGAAGKSTSAVEGARWHILAVALRFRINYQRSLQFNLTDFLINAARAFRCSEPKDKIFAFCSIPGVRQSGMPKVEYEQPVGAVYRDFSRFLIQSSGRLDVFAAHGRRSDMPNLPSWVADWSQGFEANSIEKLGDSMFAASRAYKHRDREPKYPNELIVFGKAVDVVQGVVEIPFEEIGVEDFHRHLPLRNLALLYSIYFCSSAARSQVGMEHVTATLDEMKSMVMRTLSVDGLLRMTRPPVPGNSNSPFPKEPLSAVELQRLCAAMVETVNSTGVPAHASFPTPLSSLWRLTYHRRLALLRRNTIGLIPKGARAGDIICILHGISTPSIFRRVGDRYEYRGQCYVHGIMYGEGVDWAEDSADEFVLI